MRASGRRGGPREREGADTERKKRIREEKRRWCRDLFATEKDPIVRWKGKIAKRRKRRRVAAGTQGVGPENCQWQH